MMADLNGTHCSAHQLFGMRTRAEAFRLAA